MADFKLFINGEFCDAASGDTFETFNPGTGEKIADVPRAARKTVSGPSRPRARRSTRARGPA